MTTQQLTNQQDWQQHINQWHKSALNQAQYCRQHHLKESAFSYHKNKLAHHSKASLLEPVKSSGFIQLPTSQVFPAHEPLTLRFANGMQLTGLTASHVSLVKQLVAVLI